MKTSSLVVAGIFATFLGNSAWAGGVGGGGGDAQKSTKADLEEITSNWVNRFSVELSDSWLFGRAIPMRPAALKPELAAITQKVLGQNAFGVPRAFRDYLSKLQFNISDGDCTDGGRASDSSTLSEKNAVICLSSKRLARFPKSVLRQTIIPLIFHEVGHQFGLNEAEANAFQALADLYVKYRPIFLSALRSYTECGSVTAMTLTDIRKNHLKATNMYYSFPPECSNRYLQAVMMCSARAAQTSTDLERVFDGGVWVAVNIENLSGPERTALLDWYRSDKLSFGNVTRALSEPSITGFNEQNRANRIDFDPTYIQMLGARAAMELIEKEVTRVQTSIEVKAQ